MKLKAAIVRESRYGTSQMNDSKCFRSDVTKKCESLVVLFALLIGINASLKIFNKNSVIISMKKYDTDASFSFASHTNLFYNKWLC